MRRAINAHTLNVVQCTRLESGAVLLQPQELQVLVVISQPTPRIQNVPTPMFPYFQCNLIGAVVPTFELPKRDARDVFRLLQSDPDERRGTPGAGAAGVPARLEAPVEGRLRAVGPRRSGRGICQQHGRLPTARAVEKFDFLDPPVGNERCRIAHTVRDPWERFAPQVCVPYSRHRAYRRRRFVTANLQPHTCGAIDHARRFILAALHSPRSIAERHSRPCRRVPIEAAPFQAHNRGADLACDNRCCYQPSHW